MDRALLADCGIDPNALSDAEVAERAERVRQAVARERAALAAVFDEHVADEFVHRDAARTMETMAPNPYLTHLPTLTGGTGWQEVERFYLQDFIPHWPPDVSVVPISRTIGESTVVDELVVSFTHDREMPAILPGLKPTGRRVELPHCVVVGLEQGKVAHEHIYWDQASALVQLGVLDPAGLPVVGAEAARRLMNPGSVSARRW